MTGYRCPTCGCTDLPPAFRRVIAEFEALGKRDRAIASRMIFGYTIEGRPDFGRGWNGILHEIMHQLLPSFSEAEEVGDIASLLCYTNSPDEDERPEAWSLQGTTELDPERAGNREARELLSSVISVFNPEWFERTEWSDLNELRQRIQRYLADD